MKSDDFWTSSGKSESSSESSVSYDSSDVDAPSTLTSSDGYTDYTSICSETSNLASSSSDVDTDAERPSSNTDEHSEALEGKDGSDLNSPI